jgi:catecholate siderophore receptor
MTPLRLLNAHPSPTAALLPLGAILMAGSLSAVAQTAATPEATLSTVTVKEQAEPAEIKAKNSLRATDTGIGKGQQALRDIPQTVTVMTEMLLDDRNLDDFREVLKTTAGVTFQAGETGEEDVRLRGFSLGQAGDIYVDGLRDAPLIERDTFNQDRIEVLKGSASMLFGKGSTGGVVNQVSKQPFLMDQHEMEATVGTGQELRLTGDFNIKTGDDAALLLNVMTHEADHQGATVDKKGVASTYRWGIGLKDEFSVGLYHLETDGKPLYNHPWITANGKIVPTLPANHYHGLASDYLQTQSTYGTFSHKHRFDHDTELKTTVRHGRYERELLASAIGFCNGNAQARGTNPSASAIAAAAAERAACVGQLPITSAGQISDSTVLKRTPKARVGYSDMTQVQSDYSSKFQALGLQHQLIAGVDVSYEDAERNNSHTSPLTNTYTYVGTPNSGTTVADTRSPAILNTFTASNIGFYAQDAVSLTERIKLIGGLRLDHFDATYHAPANGSTPAASFKRSDNLLSPRVGALYQPSETESYYASFGTSYNTSGDTYQFALGTLAAGSSNAKMANTDPEKSRNVEIGGKFDLLNQKASLGVALFHSEKYNERNTDSDSAATQYLLSGKRHASGMEFNLAGRITPQWEVFYNHTWIPFAKIDESNVVLTSDGTGAQVKGDRPALTPKHSASLWTTYRVAPMWRIGMGLNYRGEQHPEGARHLTAQAFTTVDAMVEYTVNEKTSVKLNVTNLTNELYADALYRGFYAPGAARAVQLTLKHQF